MGNQRGKKPRKQRKNTKRNKNKSLFNNNLLIINNKKLVNAVKKFFIGGFFFISLITKISIVLMAHKLTRCRRICRFGLARQFCRCHKCISCTCPAIPRRRRTSGWCRKSRRRCKSAPASACTAPGCCTPPSEEGEGECVRENDGYLCDFHGKDKLFWLRKQGLNPGAKSSNRRKI